MHTSVVLDKMLMRKLAKKIYLGNNRESVNTFLIVSQPSLRLLSQEETGKQRECEGWSGGHISAAGPSQQQAGLGHPLL